MCKKNERFIGQNISLPLSLRDEIAKEASRRGISISELFRLAVSKEMYVEQSAIKSEEKVS